MTGKSYVDPYNTGDYTPKRSILKRIVNYIERDPVQRRSQAFTIKDGRQDTDEHHGQLGDPNPTRE
jgi:hypothetical protein